MELETPVKVTATQNTCYHCGSACEDTLWLHDKSFCCYGCKTVFEILSANDLCAYYSMDDKRGFQLSNSTVDYDYLDEPEIRKKVIEFDSEKFARVRFYIPNIHCVSCIWLLENLQKINGGIRHAEVNFARKSVRIDFVPTEVVLSDIAKLLASVGYAPQINLSNETESVSKRNADKSLVIKLAVAGFCFGNVMLFSFPEYLGMDEGDAFLQRVFGYLNIALSIPVFLYSGFDYFRACLRSIKERQINIDVPIAIGLLALFIRSTYDILSGFGPGYLDSFTGLVFFLLIGRWFQSKTYESLAFDRDFKSYFPLAIQKLQKNEWYPVLIYSLNKNDQIKVRHMEIVPADSILLDNEAYIDYSFVTGESKPVKVKQGDLVYAGGRLVGQPVIFVVEKRTSQSHLTSLWNNGVFQKVSESRYKKIIDQAARRFTWVVMGIAALTTVYWYFAAPDQVWLILTAVLMVACPCALALASPFTYGSMLRVFGKHQFYLKNAGIIERIASIDTVVFDKTGTVTHGNNPEINFIGSLDDALMSSVRQVASCSTHPLSNLIATSIKSREEKEIKDFREIPGKGIEAVVDSVAIKMGSAAFIGCSPISDKTHATVFVSVNDEIVGYFKIITTLRKGMNSLLQRIGRSRVALLSGDNDAERQRMRNLFGPDADLQFNQSPHDKLQYIRSLQEQGKKVMMVGDGLNDSGALKQSDIGIAVTDDTGVFTPACDGILHGDKINSLDKFIRLAKASAVILKAGFVISFMYNAIALSFAVTGNLTPLIAAILMPLSSISVVSFTSMASNLAAKRIKV